MAPQRISAGRATKLHEELTRLTVEGDLGWSAEPGSDVHVYEANLRGVFCFTVDELSVVTVRKGFEDSSPVIEVTCHESDLFDTVRRALADREAIVQQAIDALLEV